MAWRSVVISSPSSLSLEDKALCVITQEGRARVMLEDISVLILEHKQITLSTALLSACADHQIVVITVGRDYLPNGLFLPYLPHSRALKVMRAQLGIPQPLKKQLRQRLIQYKINNQLAVLEGKLQAQHLGLRRLASLVRSGDPDNIEAQAAQLYFRDLWGDGFHRDQKRFYNVAINYGYAVVRSAIARTLLSYGLLPAFGLFHRNEQNVFNLADDVIEPYRAFVDAWVLKRYPIEPVKADKPDGVIEPIDQLKPSDKAYLVELLGADIRLSTHSPIDGRCTLLSAIDITVSGLSRIIVSKTAITAFPMPILEAGEAITPPDIENDEGLF